VRGRRAVAVTCSLALVLTTLWAASASAGLSGARPHRVTSLSAQDASAASWPQFHGDAGLTGLSTDTTISTANASTLGVNWMTYTGASAATSPITNYDSALGETLAYVGNVAGYFEAINTATGAIVWSDDFGKPFYASPLVTGNDVWEGTFASPPSTGRVYKMNATTGAVECSVSLGTGSLLSSLTEATPPGGSPTVYFGVQDNGIISGPIEAVNEANCTVDWTFNNYRVEAGTWAPTAYGVDANGTPLTLLGTGDPNGTLYALNANTGQLVWKNHFSNADVGSGASVSPPGTNGFADGMVYLSSEDGKLWAFNLTTGKPVWTFSWRNAVPPQPHNAGRSTVAQSGTTLVFGASAGVIAVNAITGQEIWSTYSTVGPDTEVVSSPLITGPPGEQVVVYGDLNGVINVVSLATGALLYSFQTQGYIMSSPADTNGSILIQSADGFLYDLGLGGTNSTSYPSTTITSPADMSTVPNPNSATSQQADVTISGTATAPDPDPNVLVAVQRDGPDGTWWNAATSKWDGGLIWNQATVASGSGTVDWTFNAPAPQAGTVWQVTARTQDSDGEVDLTGASAAVTISPVTPGPQITLSSSWATPASAVTVSGTGFTPGESVRLTLPGVVLATATASSTGALADTAVTIPASSPYGTYALGALNKAGQGATASIYVNSPWTQLGGNPARTGFLPDDNVLAQVEVPDKIYRFTPAAAYDSGSAIQSSPAVANKMAYVGNDAGDLVAVHSTTGALAWTATTGGAINSSPALDLVNNIVIVGSDDGNVYAFNMSNGQELWQTATGGAVDSSPTIVNGVVYVGSDSGQLFALTESTGAVLWSTTLSGEVESSPAVDTSAGLVVVGDSAGDVTAVDASTGTVVWTDSTGGAVNDTPIVYNGTVYVGSDDGNEYALSEQTGATVWSTSIGGDPSATAAVMITAEFGTDVYVGNSDGTFYALASKTGHVLWTATTGSAITGVSAVLGLVFSESANGTFSGYRGGGELVWVTQIGSTFAGTPAISDDGLALGAGNGDLYVYTMYGLPLT
jgi:outer membrane protein assembly factor BamB